MQRMKYEERAGGWLGWSMVMVLLACGDSGGSGDESGFTSEGGEVTGADSSGGDDDGGGRWRAGTVLG